MKTKTTLTRRDFVKQATTLALSASVAPVSLAAPGPRRFPVTCRDSYLKITGQPDCWAAMKELGVDGVEVVVTEAMACPGLYHPQKKYDLASPRGLKQMQDDFAAQGMAISALCMSNRLDERLELDLAWTRKVVDAARQLKVNAVRIDVVPRKTPADQFLSLATQACRQMCDLVEGTPIRLGIENHGRLTNDPRFLDQLFAAVGSSRLGLTLDALNFYWFGHPLNEVYTLCEKFAARTFHTHCKSIRYPEDKRNVRRPMGWEYEKHAAPIYEGDLDYQRIVAILRQANYPGDLCLENECLGRFPKDQHVAVLKKDLDLLKTLAA